MTLPQEIAHEDCEWEEVGLCVYCKAHGIRLYQGRLPEARRTVPTCVEHDWDDEQGSGFYSICRICGEREWFE